jgi:hypothetical protein
MKREKRDSAAEGGEGCRRQRQGGTGMTVAEKPGVLERLGGALNSGNLESIDDRIGAVDLIAALAYTQTNPDAPSTCRSMRR